MAFAGLLMLFIVSILLLTGTTILIVSLFRIHKVIDWLLVGAIAAFGTLVLVFQIANLLHKLNNVWWILAVQLILLAAVYLAWLVGKKPSLIVPSISRVTLSILLKNRQNWPLILLGGGVGISLVLYAILIYLVPPNNNDVLAFHLARVAHWLQQGSYFPWPAANVWQVTFPVNAQLLYAWTMVFTRSDHFVAYIPFTAGLLTALLIYQICRSLQVSGRTSILCGLIWLSYPVVQLHLSSARHDLVSTWLLLSAVYFLCKWAYTRRKTFGVFFAIAIALVVGTNFSIAAYLPGILILLVIFLLKKQIRFNQFVQIGLILLIAFFLFSSPIFISNAIHFGSPLGPDSSEMTSTSMMEELPLGRYLLINTMRWGYQMADLSGLPDFIVKAGTSIKASVGEAFFSLVNLELDGDSATLADHIFSMAAFPRLQEDEAWFGILGFCLMVPTSIAALIYGVKKRDLLYTVPILFLVTSFITCSLIRPGWTPYDGRYFMPLAAISTPLFAMWIPPKRKGIWVSWFAVIISLISIGMVILFNPAKQIVGGSSIWEMNRIDRLTRQVYSAKEMVYLVEAAIPEDASVGVATNGVDYFAYPLYGEHFTRKIFDVVPPVNLSDEKWMSINDIDYLLILKTGNSMDQISDSFEYFDSLGEWIVYRRK
mgnify:CR=1 FL=1